MTSPPRGRFNSRGNGWKRLLLERFGFKESKTRARSRRSQPAMLPFTVPNPLPTRNCKKLLLLATQNRSLEENLPCQSGLSTMLLCLLTIFSVIFSMTTGAWPTKKTPSHFSSDTERERASFKTNCQTLSPFFRFSFGSYSSIMTVA
jgi:hypothetical protein